MNQFPDPGINDPDVRSIPDQEMPGAEALLAGTLALMTGIAQGCCDSHRALMVKKVIANLSMLACHPMASSGFKVTIANLRVFWLRILAQGHALAGTNPGAPASGHGEPFHTPLAPERHAMLWHNAPETVQ